MSDASARGKPRHGPRAEDEGLAAELLAYEPELLDVYRSRLVEQRNPLGTHEEVWDSVRDRVRGILTECRDALGEGVTRPGPHDRRPVDRVPRPEEPPTPQGAVPVHVLRAGSLLVELVAEFLERPPAARRLPDGLSRVRLMAGLQAAVARSLEDDAAGRGFLPLDVVRDSTRQSRDAMAREIHDRIGSAAGLALRQLELYELTQNVSSVTDPRLDSLKQAILEIMHSTREVVTGLRAGTHSAESLRAALAAFVTTMAVDRPHVEIRVEDFDEPLSEPLGEHLFLVLRECLRNALAHAHAERVVLGVRCEGPRLEAHVRDDGIGLPPERKYGNGLVSVAERIRLLGGGMRIDSAPGRGTSLTFSVPRDGECHAGDR
ncbi:ATP-binding protein [Streptomyces sp. GD-15H]|uniref:sensor histidine kinase n=1 Tax=Streptomyces sp. GD-15H TaxID=3129112 RepID=UPI00324D7A83